MSRKNENTDFICEYCGKVVKSIKKGSIRNHCPYCLHSKHLDIIPGDRLSSCFGLMKPIAYKNHKKKGYQLIHQCTNCGHLQNNILSDDDNLELILTLNYS